jgi:hypothetical protein
MAAASIVNLIVSAGLFISNWRTADIARQAFETANRPYLGVNRSLAATSSEGVFRYTMFIKNFGNAPAEECRITADVTLNAVPTPTSVMPTRPQAIFQAVRWV